MDEQRGSGRRIFFTVYRVIFVLLSFCTGLFFTFWGGKLLTLGGSAWYLLAGVAYLLIAIGYLIRSQYVLPFTIVTFLLTLVWALYEVQLSYWGLIPRLVVPALLLMLGLWLATTLPVKRTAVRYANWSASAIFIALLATLVSAFSPHGGIHHGVVESRRR
ncbi:Quinate/shikimate dehydrogenase (quinone) [Raoultella ornithinolytica]|nr:Quinate/shikimate dehydrogenase (quinone) [Raoultella ornithinolytica]